MNRETPNIQRYVFSKPNPKSKQKLKTYMDFSTFSKDVNPLEFYKDNSQRYLILITITIKIMLRVLIFTEYTKIGQIPFESLKKMKFMLTWKISHMLTI